MSRIASVGVRQVDKTFFLRRSALAISSIMFVGFARNYYLRAWLGTRAISFMDHAHGVVMSAWVVLFVSQALLVAKHRVDLHRKLGIAGAGLAAVVLALGVYTVAASIERQHPHAGAWLFTELFVAFDGLSLLLFAGLVVTALANRRHPEIHKRLMLVATISLLPPAFGRFVEYFTHQDVFLIALGLMYASVLTCLILDSWRQRRVHPVLVFGGLLVIATNELAYFAQTHTP